MKYQEIQENLNMKIYEIMQLFFDLHYRLENNYLFSEYWLENKEGILDMIKTYKKDIKYLKDRIKTASCLIKQLEDFKRDIENSEITMRKDETSNATKIPFANRSSDRGGPMRNSAKFSGIND